MATVIINPGVCGGRLWTGVAKGRQHADQQGMTDSSGTVHILNAMSDVQMSGMASESLSSHRSKSSWLLTLKSSMCNVSVTTAQEVAKRPRKPFMICVIQQSTV